MKLCETCGESKPLNKFKSQVSKANGKRYWCRTCNACKSLRIGLRDYYGLTVPQYEALLHKQKGRCAACGCKPGTKRLDVDHNHETGEVRGLLCTRCNRAAGYLRDSPKTAYALAEYLSRQGTGLFIRKDGHARKKADARSRLVKK